MRGGPLRRCPGAAALVAALAAGNLGCGATRTTAPATRSGTQTTALATRSVSTAHRASPATRAAVYGGPAPLLILFKRVVGVDPLSSQLVVDTDGRAAATITLGGVSGQKRHDFTLTRSGLGALRALIAHTRLTDTPCCNDPGYYLYWISAGGHTWQLEQRRVPRPARRLIGRLNAITDAHTSF